MSKQWFDGLYYHSFLPDGKIASIRKTKTITYTSTYKVVSGRVMMQQGGSVQGVLIGKVSEKALKLKDADPEVNYTITWEKIDRDPKTRKQSLEEAKEAGRKFLSAGEQETRDLGSVILKDWSWGLSTTIRFERGGKGKIWAGAGDKLPVSWAIEGEVLIFSTGVHVTNTYTRVLNADGTLTIKGIAGREKGHSRKLC